MSAHSPAPESLARQRTGLAPAELSLVIAALAYEEAGGHPTARDLGSITGVSATATSRLLASGWLERERTARGFVLRGTVKAWRLYELGEAGT